MLQYSIPAGRSGLAMQRCVEAAVEEMKNDLDAHREGTRIYPEDVEGCDLQVTALWDEIKSLRNLASFSMSNAIQLGYDYELSPQDPLMIVTRNAVLLEFIDQELGDNSKSSIGNVMNYVLFNPILDHIPDDGSRVYH